MEPRWARNHLHRVRKHIKKNLPKYFSAEPVRYARHAQSRGQHLFCSCAVIIRLLPLLPSLLRLLEVYIYIYIKSRVYNSIASVVKFSVIMFVFMCQGESKSPYMIRTLLLLLNPWYPENSVVLQPLQCQRGRAVSAGNFVLLCNVVVEIEWEDLTAGHWSQPSASIRPISNARQKKIVHCWRPNMFYLKLNEISTKRN